MPSHFKRVNIGQSRDGKWEKFNVYKVKNFKWLVKNRYSKVNRHSSSKDTGKRNSERLLMQNTQSRIEWKEPRKKHRELVTKRESKPRVRRYSKRKRKRKRSFEDERMEFGIPANTQMTVAESFVFPAPYEFDVKSEDEKDGDDQVVNSAEPNLPPDDPPISMPNDPQVTKLWVTKVKNDEDAAMPTLEYDWNTWVPGFSTDSEEKKKSPSACSLLQPLPKNVKKQRTSSHEPSLYALTIQTQNTRAFRGATSLNEIKSSKNSIQDVYGSTLNEMNTWNLAQRVTTFGYIPLPKASKLKPTPHTQLSQILKNVNEQLLAILHREPNPFAATPSTSTAIQIQTLLEEAEEILSSIGRCANPHLSC